MFPSPMFPSVASRFDLALRLHGRGTSDAPGPPAVVAVPARDEEDRIEACLSALTRQRRPHGTAPEAGFGILLLANNCRDATIPRALALLRARNIPYRVIDAVLPARKANAGFARGLALDMASLWMGRGRGDGALLTTDADTVVPPDWLDRNLAGLAGCGAVAGRFAFDPVEAAALPAHLRRRRKTEAAYERALLLLAARLDPLPHDPWPNHWTASGASFALTLSAYRRIGGQPAVAVGEDRALAAALARHDILIRHDPDIVVTTSARLDGRAAGGCAMALHERCEARDAPGDDRLEPLPAALRRVVLRRRLRQDLAGRFRVEDWERRLALPAGLLAEAGMSPGEIWARTEAFSPLLVPHPLRPSQMGRHLAAAGELMRALDRASARREQIEPVLAGALLDENLQMAGRRVDEHLRCLVA